MTCRVSVGSGCCRGASSIQADTRVQLYGQNLCFSANQVRLTLFVKHKQSSDYKHAQPSCWNDGCGQVVKVLLPSMWRVEIESTAALMLFDDVRVISRLDKVIMSVRCERWFSHLPA